MGGWSAERRWQWEGFSVARTACDGSCERCAVVHVHCCEDTPCVVAIRFQYPENGSETDIAHWPNEWVRD